MLYFKAEKLDDIQRPPRAHNPTQRT